MGGRHIVLRKVDGAEILRRIEEHGVTLLCGAPAVIAMVLDAAQSWKGAIQGKGTLRWVVAGAPPPPPPDRGRGAGARGGAQQTQGHTAHDSVSRENT